MNDSAKKTKKLCEALHAKDPGYRSAANIDFALFIVGLILAMLAVRAFVIEPVRVDGTSMQNTLENGERCFVEKVSYLFTKPKTGDIVIVHFPGRGSEVFVKRVIATEGQTVEIGSENVSDPESGKTRTAYFVLIDGERLDESAYSDTMLLEKNLSYLGITCKGSENGVFVVPEGCVFVMGDHRTVSHDSRAVGAIPLSDVLGRVRGVVYPFNLIRRVR